MKTRKINIKFKKIQKNLFFRFEMQENASILPPMQEKT
jgi:hypothetical protein